MNLIISIFVQFYLVFAYAERSVLRDCDILPGEGIKKSEFVSFLGEKMRDQNLSISSCFYPVLLAQQINETGGENVENCNYKHFNLTNIKYISMSYRKGIDEIASKCLKAGHSTIDDLPVDELFVKFDSFEEYFQCFEFFLRTPFADSKLSASKNNFKLQYDKDLFQIKDLNGELLNNCNVCDQEKNFIKDASFVFVQKLKSSGFATEPDYVTDVMKRFDDSYKKIFRYCAKQKVEKSICEIPGENKLVDNLGICTDNSKVKVMWSNSTITKCECPKDSSKACSVTWELPRNKKGVVCSGKTFRKYNIPKECLEKKCILKK